MTINAYCRTCGRRGPCEHDGDHTATCGGCGVSWRLSRPVPVVVPEEDVRIALKTPSLHRRAWNFLKAVTKHAAGGFRHRTQDEVKTIARICRGCELFNGRACTHEKCGCGVGNDERKFLNKLYMETEHCPINKW